MQLKPFLLDSWLDDHKANIQFNLASSTGPSWTLNQILNLVTDEQRELFLHHDIVYSSAAGSPSLRAAIADMQRVPPSSVQLVTGASEALLILMWLAAEPNANVILPLPGFTTFSALPESLRIETRSYVVRKENNFLIDVEEIKRLADSNTKLVLINSPHNPTGATLSDADLHNLHDFTASRNIQLVVDEVYHPIHHGQPTQSAARLPHATVIHDFSKAFPLSGVRTGWIIDHHPDRLERYRNVRSYFTVCNTTTGEFLAEIAARNHVTVLNRTQKLASENLRHVEAFMAAHRNTIGWIPPRGGMTAFPWLLSGEDTRPFCQAAADRGLLLAPGDCFNQPQHFRIGFGAIPEDQLPQALELLNKLIRTWPN
jgi:aspartate/methionine/tyrosine aminotransferase